MSRRNIIRKYQVFTDADSTTSPESAHTDISSVDNIVYHLVVDAGVTGEVEVRVGELQDGSDSYALAFSSALSIDSGTDTEYMITIQNKGFKWMYLLFNDNVGSGNINGWISGTTVGA